jgi:hypothetical protein
MAYQLTSPFLGTLQATADYSSATSQYTLVKSTSATTCTKQVTAGGVVVGVLQDTPASGKAGNIQYFGVTKVRVDSTSHAAIAVGNKLRCSTSACALPSTLGTYFVFGRALETLAANTTGIITCQLTFEGGGSSGNAAAA